MNRFVHLLNCGLWSVNAIAWGGYTHNIPMAVTSLVAAALAAWMWWTEI